MGVQVHTPGMLRPCGVWQCHMSMLGLPHKHVCLKCSNDCLKGIVLMGLFVSPFTEGPVGHLTWGLVACNYVVNVLEKITFYYVILILITIY